MFAVFAVFNISQQKLFFQSIILEDNVNQIIAQVS